MPIIINEVIIRATVGGSVRGKDEPSPRKATAPVDTKALVEACVEEVLRVLKETKER